MSDVSIMSQNYDLYHPFLIVINYLHALAVLNVCNIYLHITLHITLYINILFFIAGELELCIQSPKVPEEGGEQAVGVGQVRRTHHLADTMHTQLSWTSRIYGVVNG